MLAFVCLDSAAAGRKSAGRKTGFMGKGKSHHRGRPDDSNTDHSSSNILNMDPDAPYRTHLLFPGRSGEDNADGRGPSGSPSLLQAVFGGSWGKKASTTGLPLGVRNEGTGDAQRYRVTPEMDPFYRGGPGPKTVSFLGDERGSEPRPDRKPNSYNCDKPLYQQQQEKYMGTPHPSANDLVSQGREPEGTQMRPPQSSASRPPSGDPYMNGKGPPVDRQQQQLQQQQQPQQQQLAPPRRGTAGQLRPTPEGTLPTEGGPLPPRTRRPPPNQSLRDDSPRGLDVAAASGVNKDCFVIPQENLERFLPDGITVRTFFAAP